MYFILDKIFDVSNTTQDVYDEFGRPIVLSAMDGFNGEFNFIQFQVTWLEFKLSITTICLLY